MRTNRKPLHGHPQVLARTEDTDEGVLSLLSRKPPFDIHFMPVYRRLSEKIGFGKKAENQTETELRKTEKKLRFSVQTETFRPLPTTYVKKYENKKIVQPAPHSTILTPRPRRRCAMSLRQKTQSNTMKTQSKHSPDTIKNTMKTQ